MKGNINHLESEKITKSEIKKDFCICLSCETIYNKNRWLFNYCPNCKSKNLKEFIK